MVQRGGTADKVGNDYEALWTVLRICDLLDDTALAIRFEPPGVDGAELRIDDIVGKCFDQVKFRSGNPWSVHALVKDGVLTKLTNQYAAGARVQLVLSNGSPDFEKLVSKAKSSETLEEFRSATEKEPNLGELAAAWETDEAGVWGNLRRTSVNSSRFDYLKDMVLVRLDKLVLGSPETVCALLKTWASGAQQQTLTGPILWNWLEAAGHLPQPRVGDPTNSLAVRRSLKRYLSSVKAYESNFGMVERGEGRHLIQVLEDSDSPGLIIVHGRAGTGKSSVAAVAAEHMANAGVHVAAIRLDGIPPGIATADQLGKWSDLVGSPVVVLSRLTRKGSKALLLIDQLDAVSEYSGRMPQSFSAVDELVREADKLGNVRVLLVSRTVDMEHDHRIRRLAETEGNDRVEVGELIDSEVGAFLRKNGIDPALVDHVTLPLLRLPIQLSVFCRLGPEYQRARYDSLSQLYAAFSRDVRSRLSAADFPDQWDAVMKALVDRMSEDEVLSAPMLALRAFDQRYVAALESENILTLDLGRFRFFHETFFDFIFALNFAPRDDELVAYFVVAGETLLRRAQLRQVLAFIATDTPRLFARQVLQILDSDMREHLKPIALSTLVEFEPKSADWNSIAAVVKSHGTHAESLASLLTKPAWFAVADSQGDVARLLDDYAFGILIGRLIADGGGSLARVVELLTDRVSRGEDWAGALRAIADRPYEPGLVEFAVRGITVGWFRTGAEPADQIPWRLFHTLCEKNPAGAVRVLGAHLDRLQQAVAETGATPGLTDLSNSLDELQPLAEAEPSLFVDHVLGFVVAAAKPTPAGNFPFGRWEYRSPDRLMRGFDEQLFYGLDDALRRIAPINFSRTQATVSLLSSEGLNSLDFLACRMLEAAGQADTGARWLLEKEQRLAIGWSSAERWESRRLIEMSSSSCSDELYESLEAKLIDFLPSRERGAHARSRRHRGSTQLQFLTALPVDRLSRKAASRISELKRKFPDWEPAGPARFSGGSVGSPVAANSAQRMTNANWLKAIDTHTGDDMGWVNGKPVGGARELAQTFGALLKVDPARYLSLAISLESPNSEPYLEEALRQSAGSIGVDQLTALCLKLRCEYGQLGSRAISYAIGQSPTVANDQLIQLLVDMSSDTDPTEDRPPYVDQRTGKPQIDYYGAGLNSARGGTAAAIRAVLFAQPERTSELLPTVDKLAKDPTLAVRAMAADATLPIINTNLAAALDIAAGLLQGPIELYRTGSLITLLTWASFNDPDRFAPYVARALGGPDVRTAGGLWLNLFIRDALRAPLSSTYGELPEEARIGAAQKLRHFPERSIGLATEMFDDPSEEVRKEAALAVSRLDNMSTEQSQLLVERFLDSASFEEHSRVLFTALTKESQLLPTRMLEACSRFVSTLETASTSLAADYQVELVIEILLRLYHQGDDGDRKACLDVIDRLTLVRGWGIERALRDER